MKNFLRKALLAIVLGTIGLYFALHLVLGSSPIQRRVVDEIRKALAQYGFDLQIESIEVSALSPKFYLNRVSIKTLKHAPFQLASPLSIDKIKLEFQPIALISRRFVIEELTLFHPRISVPAVDELYEKLEHTFKTTKRTDRGGSPFQVVVKKAGVVDALLDISVKQAGLGVRSRSLTLFVINNVSGQQTVTLSSRNLELQRAKLQVPFTNLEFDVDVTPKSVRINRAVVDSEVLYANIKGASSFPKGNKLPDSLNVSYDVRLAMDVLGKLEELKIPKIKGTVSSAGTVSVADQKYSGNGQVSYEQLSIEGFNIGKGSLLYSLAETTLRLTRASFFYAQGEVTGKSIQIELKDKFPISGDMQIKNLELDALLANLRTPDVPIRLTVNSPLKVSGALNPLELQLNVKPVISPFRVLGRTEKSGPVEPIIETTPGEAEGMLVFSPDRMAFRGNVGILDGKLETEGYVTYDSVAKIKIRGTALSLTKLKRIATLPMRGIANAMTEIDVVKSDARVAGSFEIEEGEIASVYLGGVKGQAFFQDGLLSFENLLRTTQLEPVKGNGFVDFMAEPLHYKFHVETRRLDVGVAFDAFRNRKLPFQAPVGGEVNARMTIEGGHDDEGMEVIASGQGRNFKWYEEDWLTSQFFVSFRPAYTDVRRLLLMKKTGGVELRARFADDSSRINVVSRGLKLEEINRLGKAPLTGEVVGQITLEGDLQKPTGQGEIRLVGASFRSSKWEDSLVKVTSDKGKLEVSASLAGERLKAKLNRSRDSSDLWNVLFVADDFDFAPLILGTLKKDVVTVGDIRVSGDVNLKGRLSDWRSFRGVGTLNSLYLGLRGTPMKNEEPIDLEVDSGKVKVGNVRLVGRDGQLAFNLAYEPERSIRANLDGKIDLQFLQPFIPGLEYGTGKMSAGLRVTGTPRNINLLGNVGLEDGTVRFSGMSDDLKATRMQLSLSQDKINVDRFEANVNGGTLVVDGDVRVNQFNSLIPNLRLQATAVTLRTGNFLTTKLSGDFGITGDKAPYLMSGKCRILEGRLVKFEMEQGKRETLDPIFRLDIACDAKDKLYVITDIMNAEFKGNFHLLGNNIDIGLLGAAESIQGSILFRERKFALNAGNVKFESATKIAPRFSVSGRTVVRESKSGPQNQLQAAQEYEVNLQVYGTPQNYKILLSSTPELAEADIISLLLLGVTTKGGDGNYADLGTTIVGQLPFQQKLENQLGLEFKLNTQTSQQTTTTSAATSTSTGSTSAITDVTVPSVQIQKTITDRTKVSYSNTLQSTPVRELKIEHMLDDHWSVNGTAGERPRAGAIDQNTTSQAYGLDFRYRFQFE